MEQDKYYKEDSGSRMQGSGLSYRDGQSFTYEEAIEGNEDLETLLDFLTEALNKASTVPLTNKRLVNVDMCLDALHNIRENLPVTVQQSIVILNERDQIIDEAIRFAENKQETAIARADSVIEDANMRAAQLKSDAEDRARKIIADAESRAQAAVEQSAITRQARDLAEQMEQEARAESNEQRLQALRYSEGLLRDMEQKLNAKVDEIRRIRQNLGAEER